MPITLAVSAGRVLIIGGIVVLSLLWVAVIGAWFVRKPNSK